MTEALATLSHYSPAQWALIAGAMTLGSVIQGAVGFASGLIGVPLLVMGGVPLHEAATINFLLTSVQNTAGAVRLREELTFRETALPVVLRWVGLPLGAAAMWWSAGLDPATVKQVIGVVLLASIVALGVMRPAPRDHIPAWVTAIAFVLSGFLLGFAAIGGAPMVLYVNALKWSAAKSRAFLFFVSATGVPPMAALVAWNFGAEVLPACVAAALLLPLIWAGLLGGFWAGQHFNKRLFRQITFSLLALIALSAIAGPYLTW